MRCVKYLLICLLIFACSDIDKSNFSDKQDLNDMFMESVRKLNPNENPKIYVAYLMIPNTGCSGCINSAESVLKDMYNKSSKVKFILTNVVSLKTLHVKLGIQVTHNENILVDTDNIFDKTEFNSIYPQIFFVSKADGKIFKRMEISPKEDGLSELMKLL